MSDRADKPAVTLLSAPAFVAEQAALLRVLPLCAGIEFESMEAFFRRCEYRLLQSGELLLAPGQHNEHLYVLLSGELTIYIDAPGSANTILVNIGEFVGEVSIVDGQAPTGFVGASQDSVVLCIHETLLWGEFFRIGGAARNLMRQIARRMRDRNVAVQKGVEQALRLEHLEKELRIAQELQASMLPVQPFFPHQPALDIDAIMKPAKEVGGDFYDAFPLHADAVCVAIGDVAGKGVPAALFMVRTLTLLRTQMLQTNDISRAIHAVNAMLCQDNAMFMFVTLAICVIDLRAGEMQFVNGGHNPMVFGNDREGYGLLAPPKGILLGIDEDARFEISERKLAPGDTLVLYTDGITEAMNAAQAEYTDRRLLACLNEQPGHASAQSITSGIHSDVQAFVGDAEPSDDLTLMVVRYLG